MYFGKALELVYTVITRGLCAVIIWESWNTFENLAMHFGAQANL